MDSSSKSKILKQQHDDFGDPGDRISELPIEILLHILSYLPTMKKIVSTSALSRKWKSLWTLSPTFNLNYDSGEGEELHHISLDSVQKDLELIPKSASIGTFRLRFSMLSHASNTRYKLFTLLTKALIHGLEELDCGFYSNCRELWFPDSLFTSKSLVSLKLYTSVELIKIPWSICFPKLKTLHLECITFKYKGETIMGKLISGCPVLEDLQLHFCTWNHFNGLRISIPTLQRLSVCFNDTKHIFLRIHSPNLRSFKLSCSPFKIELCHLPSLAEADLDIKPCGNQQQILHHARGTRELIDRICHVKSLKLSHSTLQIISGVKKFNVNHLPTFYNLTRLEVSGTYAKYRATALMYSLQSSPILQSLHFSHGLDLTNNPTTEAQPFQNDDAPLCLKRCLKTFSISNFRGTAEEICFLRYILHNADVLEHFRVHCSKVLARETKMSIERDLSRRKDCEIVFL